MQVIQDTNMGGRLGAAFGTGLQQLAQNKLQQLQNQQYTQSLASIPGMNPQVAQLLSSLSPEERKQVWPNIGSLMQLYQQGSQPAQGQQQPQAQQQIQPGAQEQQQVPQQSNLLQDVFTSPQQKQQKELLGLKKESVDLKKQALAAEEARENRKEVKPFIQGHREDLKTSKELNRIATEMKDIALKHGKDFPNWPFTLAPSTTRRDPNVRRYEQLANQLVTLKSNGLKGQATNFKVKLLQTGKVDLDQPLDTQLSELDSLINSTNETFKVDDIIKDIRTKNRGNLPVDVQELLEERLAEQQPQQQLDLPPANEQFEEGSQWETSSGEIFEYRNGNWVPVAA